MFFFFCCPQRNQITTIPAGSLPSNLSEISLVSNPIETIDDKAFDESLDTLQTLTISGARFSEIPNAVLRLNALKNLNIYETNIIVWHEEAMKRFSSTLEQLSLATVGFTTWPTWIQTFSRLSELSVSSSSIASVPDDAFDKVVNTLTSLGLSNNSLTIVPKAVSKLRNLTKLSIEQNKITGITWLPHLSNLSTLSLNNNKVSDSIRLSDTLLLYKDTLFSFDIHDNQLTAIPDLSFLKQITSLDFTNNRISDPNSGSVPPGLTELNLNYNLLPSIPRILGVLHSVPYLVLTWNRINVLHGSHFPVTTKYVDLSHNLIAELTNTSFPENSSIEDLTLDNNPLSTIFPSAFKNLPYLIGLSLQHTNLTRVPVSISYLNKLEWIDFTGSVNLVCTCMEKSLEAKISSMIPTEVSGDCGQTSLYDFFKRLSPECPEFNDL